MALPTNPIELVNSLDRDAILNRLAELKAEQKALSALAVVASAKYHADRHAREEKAHRSKVAGVRREQ
jgi:hypothetical protein